ncbi:MAG: hypothetical protein M3510_13095 [Actinomycetota bacterium]|nr:hypothetical protein [Actinomycetota bacterium]
MRMFVIAALVATASIGGTAVATAQHGSAARPYVVEITGTPDRGFHVVWSDGDEWWTPTRSETMAECTEYDTAVGRAICRGEERTEYRWMGVTKRSLRHSR